MPGLEDLYREIILDHYRSPETGASCRAHLPPSRRLQSPVRRRGGRLRGRGRQHPQRHPDIGQGCSISQSSASLMSGAVKGKSLPEVRDLIRTFKAMMSIHEARLGDGEADDPVRSGP